MAGPVPVEDLFELADAVAALLDAPITIEDRGSRVLAYSQRQDRADRARIETIMGRRMPSHYTRRLERDGVFRRLYGSDRPVYLGGRDGGWQRAAVGVRAGDEILGTIWATLAEPLTPERERALMDASRSVARHLLHARTAAADRRRHARLVAAVLDGDAEAGDLGLPAGPYCVLALGLRGADRAGAPGEAAGRDEAHREGERQRAAAAFATHLSATCPDGVIADVEPVTYAIVPGGPSAARRAAGGFTARIGRTAVVVGVGRSAPTLRDVPRSRAAADRALRVLRRGGTRQVAGFEDVQAEALVLEMADALGPDGPAGPVARVLEYDRAHGTDLAGTLRAWLDAFGDVNAAAARRHVHPNTVRYRLRKIAALADLDLADPDQRFATELMLRLTAVNSG